MEEKNKNVLKQVYILFGLLLFAFVNVFLFSNKAGIGFSVFSTLTLLTIGLLSKRTPIRILGIVSYVVNVIAAWFGLSYLGWLTAVQAIELIFVVWYVYPQDTFLKTDTTDKFVYRYRLQQLFIIAMLTTVIYIGYRVASLFWSGSFLEFGGNTAFIFGVQYFLYVSLANSHEKETMAVEQAQRMAEHLAEIKKQSELIPPIPQKKSSNSLLTTDVFVKIAAIWLIVMDLSILSYLIKPNDIGFGVGAFFVLLSIVISLFVKTQENPEDVFSVIYHKIRPIQPVFFIILLIAHAHQFSYGAAYALLFAAAYFVWAINKINMKTLLTVTILIYFFPVFGYISNPFRLGANNIGEAAKMLIQTGPTNYFNLGNWLDFSADSFSDKVDSENLEEQVRDFSEELTIDSTNSYKYTGVWDDKERDNDLSVVYDEDTKTVTVSPNIASSYKDLELTKLEELYTVRQSVDVDDDYERYQDYYLVDSVLTDNGIYYVYIRMNDDWIKDYKADPATVSYHLLIIGGAVSPSDVVTDSI